jgi:Transposase IS200 like
MSQDHNHLNHATWECKYHFVFTPKYRKKVLFGQIRRHLGTVFHELAWASPRSRIQKERTPFDSEKSPCPFSVWFPLIHKGSSDPCTSCGKGRGRQSI